jgi:hypothetical protein
MTEPGYEILSLDDLERYPGGSGQEPVLMPLRRRLGFRPFGVNCWTATAAGGQVIQPHSEPGGDEELYVVVRGRATFTVRDETVDAPAGTLVHVPPDTPRRAVAAQDGTLVLAVGAKPGEAFDPVPWEEFHIAFSKLRSGKDPDGARSIVADVLARYPDTWEGEYNAACFEAVAGDPDAAFAHLQTALERNREVVARYAPDDGDLASLRDDPRWRELLR